MSLKAVRVWNTKTRATPARTLSAPTSQRLLQDIRLGLIKRVIVYKLDRISRSIVGLCKAHGTVQAV